MISNFSQYISSSIGRKQIVAVTGLLLILFVIGHLAGNLIMFMGAEAYNHYAQKLAGLRPGLYFVEFGLLAIFIVHMWVTALLVLENIKARSVHYAVEKPVSHKSLSARATKIMPYTGTLVLLFVVWHLIDFTFVDHEGPRSVMADGISYGLYGVVYNAFLNPIHSLFYIAAMFALGLHLSHGIQSFCQTFGFPDSKSLNRMSVLLGFFIALLYSSIPFSIMLKNF